MHCGIMLVSNYKKKRKKRKIVDLDLNQSLWGICHFTWSGDKVIGPSVFCQGGVCSWIWAWCVGETWASLSDPEKKRWGKKKKKSEWFYMGDWGKWPPQKKRVDCSVSYVRGDSRIIFCPTPLPYNEKFISWQE